ncbi:hypothetical protein [Allobranchiibius sp. GilTou38]|uniref:TraR/DksA family transcriptional regulator n=1 Tax=Allobranchiibius sp. GilTou38 TaxID=2815210 RepID=UPI001AA0E7C3|nr:hypothetical protein [Allobranchiibius sp. GilTou38]MBO1765809.1 hypothetical protein [Allobranchiibius sp. GilTou38]
MDADRARTLLEEERAEVQSLLTHLDSNLDQDRETGRGDAGDDVDSAQPLAADEVDDATAASLRDRLAAIERAEKRLADGTFGLSVRSGTPIPDERLEVMPTAELTVEEAAKES